MRITEPVTGIYKFEVPFEDIYTAVFAVREGERYLLIDSATTAEDVDTYILPALAEIGLEGRMPEALLLTHPHEDHAGGAKRLSEVFSGGRIFAPEEVKGVETETVKDGMRFLNRIETLALPGHTRSCVGYLDRRNATLISGDSLQLCGVSRYTNGIRYPDAYLRSIDALREREISCILASHEYVPLGSIAKGKDAVLHYLDECARVCPRTESSK